MLKPFREDGPPSAASSAEPLLASGASAVSVRATARLHLGFLDLNGGLGRRFGSLGMALDAPETRILLCPARNSVVTGEEQDRSRKYLSVLEAAFGLPRGHALEVRAAIPPHAGLGSGTQLALAIAAALRRLHGLKPDWPGDAARLGRGSRSGIGIALFRWGGLVLDGGRGEASIVPPPLARLAVPAEWRVLLLHDPARRGLSGPSEHSAFAALSPMPEAQADRLCRLTVIQALPALAEADLPRFGAAITEIQRLVGAYFAPAQGGGVYASEVIGAALRRLGAAGATGLGQSSWGPTGFAFVGSAAEAQRLAGLLRHHFEPGMLSVSVHRPHNQGAKIAAARATKPG